MHQRTRFISFLLVVSILLSTLYLPIVAEDTAVPEAVSPAISSAPETVANAPAELLQGIPVDFESEAILKHVDQDAFRTANHTLRLPKEESLNTYVYMNDNGTKTVYFMDENVKYVDKEGNVQEKDISLKETKNGFTTVKNDVSVFIPTNAANGIQVSHSIGNVKLIPQNSLLVVAGRQDGDSVLYPNYFGKGISLRYTPLLSGVKEDIILASYTGTHSFQFALETNGLFVYEDASGYYVAASADAEERYALGEIIVYDAVGRPSMGSMTVKTITAGRRYVLTVSADPAFLTDADTVYPVTIDPTITVNGQTDASLIWDVPIFSGYPTWTCGAYQYLTLGNAGGNYGTGRAVVKLPGLYQSSIYQSLTMDQITDVSFYCSDGSGNASQYIGLYPHMGSTTWTESNASWNSIGMYESGYDYGTQVAHGVFTKFDITELVQLWKFGLFFEGAGFILVNADETTREKHKAIHSTEYATASYRPYVVMEYIVDVSIDNMVLELFENETCALTVTTEPAGLPVTWSSADESIATVSNTGVVTTHHAGTTEIWATATASDGSIWFAICDIEVRIKTGVYYIQNINSELYLGVREAKIVSASPLGQYGKFDSATSEYKILSQQWRICHLGQGFYSIRPMHSLSMGIGNSAGTASIFDIGAYDILEGIPFDRRWTITWHQGGYIFRYGASNSAILQVDSDSMVEDTLVSLAPYSTNMISRQWSIEPVLNPSDGIILYAISSQTPIPSYTKRSIMLRESKTIEDFGLKLVVYSGSNINQSVSWQTSNSNVLECKTNGTIIGKTEGEATITAYKTINGITYAVSFDVAVVTIYSGTYLIKNRQHNKYLQVDDNDAPTYSTNGANLEQWSFVSGVNYQKWHITLLEDGYYKIISAQSGLALSVKNGDLSNEDVTLAQQPYVGAERQMWKIVWTPHGSIKIKAKSSETTTTMDLVMVAGNIGTTENGTVIQQRKYINNDSYKDEWLLYRVDCNNINIEVNYDQSYINRYSGDDVAYNHIMNIMTITQEYYYKNFGLWINFDSITPFISYADQCSTNPDVACIHSMDSGCQNSTLYDDHISARTHHHTNITNILARVDYPDLAEKLKLIFAGHNVCLVDGSGMHDFINGYAYPGLGMIAVAAHGEDIYGENDQLLNEAKVLIHELGHLFYAPDHYGNENYNMPSSGDLNQGEDGPFDELCIYGEYKDVRVETMRDFVMCNGCREIILENIHRFSHNE